jgi:ribonuclease HI
MLTLRFDGLYYNTNDEPSKPAPANAHTKTRAHAVQSGVMCYGWLIYHGEKLVARGHGGFVRQEAASSNIAEYLALIEGLQALVDMHIDNEDVEIIGDARSLIEQMNGTARVNANTTRPLYRKALLLSRHFPLLTWTWTPRRQNHAADQLTRRAMKQIRADPDRFRQALQRIKTPALSARLRKHLFSLLDLRVYQPAGMIL